MGALYYIVWAKQASHVNSELLQGFYLGDALVEPLKGQVTGRDASTHLPPKAVEVLLCLAEHAGEIVGRETLLDRVWGVGHGSQEALSHAVSEIRQAFDDQHDNPHVVQTMPKRGYRLLLIPEIVSESTSSVVLGTKDGARSSDIGFMENLKRRGVLETLVAYLIVGWLLIQVADIVFERLGLPDKAATFVTWLVIAGLPIALVVSWYLEFRDGKLVVHNLTPADARRRRFSHTYLSVIGALALAGGLVLVYDQNVGLPTMQDDFEVIASGSPQLPPVYEDSFAVLPFAAGDSSEETLIFANGLVDDLITRLSRVPGLRVASRGDSFTLQPNTPSSKVRERLRVEMYLEGSVEMSGDQMRVIVQLIDSETGFHRWGRTFTRARDEFFAVRDEIAGLTVANVRPALPAAVRSTSLTRSIDESTLDAYLLYRRGIDTLRQPLTIDTVSAALGWLDAALAVDPEYAAAHAGKCAAFVTAYVEVDDGAFIEKAESACASALALNPNLDIVHTALGELYYTTGRNKESEDAYRRALAVDPSNVEALTGLGYTLLRLNRLDEAEASLTKAVDIHPGDWGAFNSLGNFYFATGQFEKAAARYEYVVALAPENMNAFSNLGAAYMMMNNFEAAAPMYERAIEIEPTKSAYSNLGLLHYYLGDYDAAIENHRKAVELKPGDYLALSNLGDALWVSGREADALSAYQQAEPLAAQALDINWKNPLAMMDLAWIRAMLGKDTEAQALISNAVKLAPDDPYSYYYDGLVHLSTGDREKALKSFAVAVEKGYSRRLLAVEPLLESIRLDPRFSELVSQN